MTETKENLLEQLNALSPKELSQRLIDNSKRHRYYYHYTQESCLKGIITSSKLWLSSFSKMNDKDEDDKGDARIRERCYAFCLNYGSRENMAMWGLYAEPKDRGIRIEFSKKAFTQIIDCFMQNPTVYRIKNTNDKQVEYEKIDSDYQFKLFSTDILYQEIRPRDAIRENKLKYKYYYDYSTKQSNTDFASDVALTAQVKDGVWEYEHEVRLLLLANKKLLDAESVAISIPSDVIKSITVRCGPWCKGNIENEMMDYCDESILINTSKFVNCIRNWPK